MPVAINQQLELNIVSNLCSINLGSPDTALTLGHGSILVPVIEAAKEHDLVLYHSIANLLGSGIHCFAISIEGNRNIVLACLRDSELIVV